MNGMLLISKSYPFSLSTSVDGTEDDAKVAGYVKVLAINSLGVADEL